MTQHFITRARADIQSAVVSLVDRLVPIVAVARQPAVARKIAEVIAARPSSMFHAMHIRQSIIRRGVATHDQVIDGLASWVTVLFDLGNLRHDRRRALDLRADISDEALARLTRSLAMSRNGCILAVPHIGSVELFVACLKDRGFNLGFVYTIGAQPTQTERWIYEGRSATYGKPIAFGRRSTGTRIANVLRNNGVLFMVVDVYPTAKYAGIRVGMHGGTFNFPPGPARYARSGTLVLPGFASRRHAEGVSMQIADPIDYPASMSGKIADQAFTQALADHIGAFTVAEPAAFWLWHPIPNDPFLAVAQRHRPDLLLSADLPHPDDEATALAVEAMTLTGIVSGIAALPFAG